MADGQVRTVAAIGPAARELLPLLRDLDAKVHPDDREAGADDGLAAALAAVGGSSG